ncbi:MAG: hypothetical protein D4R73_02355 [Deltaproteobacteria bacterium]|nr:MAG: hypothetical protein D4R73_02355 [Deltaproteobacteria bacterium]
MLRLLVHIGMILLLSLAGFNCSPSDDRAKPIAGPSGPASRLENPAPAPNTDSVSERPKKAPKANSKLRIRLKRDVKGKYSWEITGDDVRQIIDADRPLRKKFGTGD